MDISASFLLSLVAGGGKENKVGCLSVIVPASSDSSCKNRTSQLCTGLVDVVVNNTLTRLPVDVRPTMIRKSGRRQESETRQDDVVSEIGLLRKLNDFTSGN